MAPYPGLYEPGGVLDTVGVMVPGAAGARKESGKAIDIFSKYNRIVMYATSVFVVCTV